MKILAESRCRVDLGGGTLDIWPIGLMFPGACTVNLAIDLPVLVEMEPIESGFELTTPQGNVRYEDLDGLAADPDGGLVATVVGALDLPPIAVRLTSGSPRGGGLGASSAMTVGLIAAADRLRGDPSRGVHATAALARDIEARLMCLPTGTQDHFPSLLGGVLSIEYRPGATEVRPLKVDLSELGEHMLVVYSGKSHFSASTNWQIIRGCLEADPGVRGLLAGIAEVSRALPTVLEAGHWQKVGELVGREWSYRRHLADGVSMPAVDSLLEIAQSMGAWGGKVCGAGGGGCVVILCPRDRREIIGEALGTADGQVLDVTPTDFSLSVRES